MWREICRNGKAGALSAVLSALLVASCGSPRIPSANERRPKPGPVPSPRPDIVLISIDSLRADHVQCYGYPKATSPTIDRIAAEGLRFANAISASSWTLPSYTSLFSGLYCATHGVIDQNLRLSDRVVTLPEVLKNAGYRTAGFYGAPYLYPAFGFGRGFDLYASCRTRRDRSDLNDGEKRRPEVEGLRPASEVSGPRTVEMVTEWLDDVDDRPFFLFIQLFDVHYDYNPPHEYARAFGAGPAGMLDSSHAMRNSAINRDMPKRELEHLIALYDGEIRFTDENISKILGELDRRGRLDSSVVVITADHGEEFFEHGNKGHGASLYDEVLRVPLVFRWRGQIPSGRVVGDQVRLIDVMPTLASLAGAPLPADVQGRDLNPLLRGESMEPEPALCEVAISRGGPRLSGVRTNRFKFVSFPTRHWWQVGYQFFDLEADPGETRVLSRWSGGYSEMKRTLARLRGDAEALRVRLGETAVRGVPLDEEQKERLRGLGYLDGDH